MANSYNPDPAHVDREWFQDEYLHGFAADTLCQFTYSRHIGGEPDEITGLDDFQIRRTTKDALEEAVAAEHREWLLEQVQDNSCFAIGEE